MIKSDSVRIQIPSALMPGDKIAITAPSSGVPKSRHLQLDAAIKNLQLRGYEVIEGDCLRQEYKDCSADRKHRAKELMQFLCDPTIKAIMPPWGGELAMEILGLLDFEILKKIPAKWFSGFSDLSTLQVPLTTISGWATLHGPNLMELSPQTLDATTQKIWDILEGYDAQNGIIEQSASHCYQEIGTNGFTINGGFNLTVKTAWKAINVSAQKCHFSGVLIGGCLDTLAWLAGTQYADLPQFYQAHKAQGVILYLENAEMAPCTLTRALLSLKMKGWFHNISGILFGRNAAEKVTDPAYLSYEEVLQNIFANLDIPVIYDVDIGHVPPQLSLVNGIFAEVFLERGKGRVIQKLL